MGLFGTFENIGVIVGLFCLAWLDSQGSYSIFYLGAIIEAIGVTLTLILLREREFDATF